MGQQRSGAPFIPMALEKRKHQIQSHTQNIRLIAAQTLSAWYETNTIVFLERELFSHPQDYTFYKHLVSNVIRHKRKYQFVIEWLTERSLLKLDREVIICLMLGLTQLEEDSKIELYAAINETVELATKLGKPHLKGFINANLRRYTREKKQVAIELQKQIVAVRSSHDEFSVKRWTDQFGVQIAAEICESNNLLPEVQVVINPRFERESVISDLQKAGFVLTDVHLTGFTVKNPSGLFASEWMKKGAFLVQDQAFQRLNSYITHLPKSVVLDACAAPGGKLIHLEWSFDSQIDTLVGIEISGYRLARLRHNTENLGSRTLLVQADILQFPFKKVFDLILLDVPCSGTGIIRKHPEIKWSRSQGDLDNNHEVQFAMLQSCSQLLKPGGHVMYITCSLESEENQNVIERFLKQQESRFQHVPYQPSQAHDPYVTPEGYYQCLPTAKQMGCFSALLKMTGN